MKSIKFRTSSDILTAMYMDELFIYFNEIEVKEIYNYSERKFFALILFHLKVGFKFEDVMKELKVEFQNVKELGNHRITSIVQVKRDDVFFPLLTALIDSSIVLVPPLRVDNDSVHINCMVPDEKVDSVLTFFETLSSNVKILAISNSNKVFGESNASLMPDFTSRQEEIARFAVRNGYFNSPKSISAKKIAEKFKISVSAINEHLRKVKKQALEFFFS